MAYRKGTRSRTQSMDIEYGLTRARSTTKSRKTVTGMPGLVIRPRFLLLRTAVSLTIQ